MTTVGEEAPEPGPVAPRGGQGAPGLELRIALAMRGGVSLAVWIGGAIAELDLARRGMLEDDQWEDGQEEERERAAAYAALLRRLGYTGLSLDVLAGASAGGLNAVIYGLAQSVGSDLEWLRGVWEQQGDLWRLYHDAWDPAHSYRTEAVLNADAAFYETVLAELRAHAESGREARVTSHLTVDLAATLQSGPPLPDRRTGADLRPRTAHFRFRRTPATPSGPFNDMPAAGDRTGQEQALRRLAYAARATSSFPGAFEPAGVFSWDGPASGERPPDDPRPVNMAAVFSEVGADDRCSFDVMDGGVFDNIPISRAVQAIADAPASDPTRRVLVYLDPSPPTTSSPPAATPAFRNGERLLRARFLRSALTALRYKQTVETSWDDLREIGRLRQSLDDLQARRRKFLDDLRGSMDRAAADTQLDGRYTAFRARTDAARVTALMTAPGVGFLRALVPSPAVATSLGADDADRVQGELRGALAAVAGHDCPSDATTLVGAADLLISWVRGLQDTAPSASLAAAKSSLYRARTIGLYVEQRHDAAAVSLALGTAATAPCVDADPVAARLWPPEQAPASAADPAGPVTGEDGLWTTLTTAVTADDGGLAVLVRRGWATAAAAVGSVAAEHASDGLVAATVGTAPGSSSTGEERLQLLAVAASLELGSLRSTTVPQFFTFTGDEAPLSPELLDKVALQGTAFALDRRAADANVPAPADPFDARSKLAGNQLANFAGFLAADWRRHDWTWGRADAGAGLLRILRSIHPDADPAHFADAQRGLDLLYPALNRRKLVLADVPAGRRFALGARLGLGLQRALWPLTPRRQSADPHVKPVHLLGVVALMLMRPVLLLVPLLLRVPVLAAALILCAGAHHLNRSQAGAGQSPPVLVALVCAVVIAVMLLGIISLDLQRRRWRVLARESPGALPDAVVRRIGRATVLCGTGVVVGIAGFALALLDWERVDPVRDVLLDASGYDLALVVGVAVGVGVRLRSVSAHAVVQGDESPVRPDREGWLVATGLVVAAAAITTAAALLTDDDAVASEVASATAVAVVVWALHHAWTRTWWAIGVAALSGVVVFLLVHHRVHWGFGASGMLFEPSGRGQAWEPVLDVLLLVAVLAIIFVLAVLGRWLTEVLAELGKAACLLLLLVAALWGVWQLTLAWGWLDAVPLALLLGAVAGAGTTLLAPFADLTDSIEVTAPRAESADARAERAAR